MNTFRIAAGITCAMLAVVVPSSFAQAGTFTKPVIGRPIAVNPGVLKGLPVQVVPTYKFTLKSFKITDTRSVHEDTDFASIAVAVGTGTPITLPAKSMGNLNNGTYQVNLTIPAAVADTQAVDFSYSIVNSGYDKNALEQALKSLVSDAANKGAKAGGTAGGTAVAGPVGGAIGGYVGDKAGGWAVGKLVNIIFANCDGSVAAGDHIYSGAELAAQTANGRTITITDNNPGTDSPYGCGSNSRYYATWSISRS